MSTKLIKKSHFVKNISAKDVWKNEGTTRIEEKCMSPFIVENLDEISKITGYDLEVTNMELYVGDFRADIVCKDNNTGDVVVIENQLDQSDHDHLGKALTYLTNLDAKGIIWICEHVRSEHLKAVEKLNEITPDEYNFYFLELKFEKYGDNAPVYDFKERFIPSSINKLATRLKNVSESSIEISSFFEKFIKELNETTIPTARIIKGKNYHWIYRKPPIYVLASRPSRENIFKIEINFDETKLSKNANVDEYIENFEVIKNVLKSKGYDYNEIIGKKNSDLHKLIYSVDFDSDNIDEYKKMCYDAYKTVFDNWKK